MKTRIFITAVLLIMVFGMITAQETKQTGKKRIAIISMDIKGLSIDKETMRNMVQLEVEKTNIYEVMDKYDVSDIVKKNGLNVDECYGKNCLIQAGKLLNADKMMTGNIEKFGDKLIFIIRLVDVESGVIEKTDVMEYINQQDQIQIMVRLSVNNILGVENDKLLVDLLVNFDQPVTSSKTTLKLNGPRVGFLYSWGESANIMQLQESEGGYNMYPVNCLIGYQFEKQFLSSGDFQALLEFVPSVTGMESGYFAPSGTAMLGFRFNKSGLEFGLGPVVRIVRTANGYYDSTGTWQLERDIPAPLPGEISPSFQLERRIDRRGSPSISSGMIFAVGKTFRSGYLNMPVNIYYSPRKEGSVVGITFGFNVASRPKFDKK